MTGLVGRRAMEIKSATLQCLTMDVSSLTKLLSLSSFLILT